jgi:kynureninase
MTGRIVGARVAEVTTANTLTVNLHLLMASFYRPEGRRSAILIDAPTFPSDRYAVDSQVRHRGLDPATEVVVVGPRTGESTTRIEDIEAAIHDHRDRLAMTLLAGVNFATGQSLDIGRLTEAAHRVGAVAGWDLAHAAGNIPLALHDADVDFAAWCTYKYLNGGPGADGWRISTPPMLSLAPIGVALGIIDSVGMAAVRRKSVALTAYLEVLIDALVPDVEIITPRDPERRGAQLSIRVADAEARLVALADHGVVGDVREPDIIRLAPAPLYNSWHDAWRAAHALAATAPIPSDRSPIR